jgi:hypothetical protein
LKHLRKYKALSTALIAIFILLYSSQHSDVYASEKNSPVHKKDTELSAAVCRVLFINDHNQRLAPQILKIKTCPTDRIFTALFQEKQQFSKIRQGILSELRNIKKPFLLLHCILRN